MAGLRVVVVVIVSLSVVRDGASTGSPFAALTCVKTCRHGRAVRIMDNIISDRVEMQLTVRSDTPEVREQLLDGIDRVAAGVALAMGVPADLMPEVIRSPVETTPPTLNDPATARRVLDAIAANMGEEYLWEDVRQGMGAEDFAYFVQPETGVKGVYFSVVGVS